MHAVRCLLAFLLLSLPITALAEKDPAKELAKQIKGQTLILRVNYEPDTLAFDAQGKMKGALALGTVAWSGVTITNATVENDALTIKGHRALLISTAPSGVQPTPDQIRMVTVDKRDVTITIDRDPALPGKIDQAFHQVFSSGVEDLVSGMPANKAKDLLLSLPSLSPQKATESPSADPETVPSQDQIFKPGGSVTPPRVAYFVDPIYPKSARSKNLDCVVLVGLIVDREGRPNLIHIVRAAEPANPVLDTNAIIAISQYRFSPATKDGMPVASEVNVQVHFKIY